MKYDLSHLDAHIATYIDSRNSDRIEEYAFLVTYSCHCFAKEMNEDSDLNLIYVACRESREFNFERYELSKGLRAIIETLPEQLVFHAGYSNYAVIKSKDMNGNPIDYFIVFKAFKEKKKFRLHVVSAYPNEEIGKIKKVKFLAIASNLAKGKPLPKPPK